MPSVSFHDCSVAACAASEPRRAALAPGARAPNSGTRSESPTIFMVMGPDPKPPPVGTLTTPNSSMGAGHASACGTRASAASPMARLAASMGLSARTRAR